jgi:hypothetical protein
MSCSFKVRAEVKSTGIRIRMSFQQRNGFGYQAGEIEKEKGKTRGF